MRVGVYALGTNDLDLRRMVEYVRMNWVFVNQYKDFSILLRDANANRINYVLIFNKNVFLGDEFEKLKRTGVTILDFKDKDRLERALEMEMKKRERKKEDEKRSKNIFKEMGI